MRPEITIRPAAPWTMRSGLQMRLAEENSWGKPFGCALADKRLPAPA
jgi:hypothetical protein